MGGITIFCAQLSSFSWNDNEDKGFPLLNLERQCSVFEAFTAHPSIFTLLVIFLVICNEGVAKLGHNKIENSFPAFLNITFWG